MEGGEMRRGKTSKIEMVTVFAAPYKLFWVQRSSLGVLKVRGRCDESKDSIREGLRFLPEERDSIWL